MPQRVETDTMLGRLKLGDPSAFSLLYEYYWEEMYINAYKRVKDEDIAKDIVQTVFIDLWQRHETLQITTDLNHYLNAAVKFQVFSYFRSEKATVKVIESTIKRFEYSCTINDLDGYYELEKLIEEEIALLPDKMKEAYLLKAAKHSTAEIAAKLNLKEQTVSNHISEALRRIRIKLGSKYPEWVIAGTIILLKSLHN